MPDTVMLFAAGFGTRMGDLTKDRPKPLIEVAGKALLDHALELTQRPGIARRIVNAHYLADQIITHLEGYPDLWISREDPDILDTGGGLKHVLTSLRSGPLYTLNTDAVWTGPNPLDTLRRAWTPKHMDALVLLVPSEAATGHSAHGDFDIDGDGRITRGQDYVYTGTQILQSSRVAEHPERIFSLNKVWDACAADGRLFGAVHLGDWCDVGHPGGIAEAEAMLRDARP